MEGTPSFEEAQASTSIDLSMTASEFEAWARRLVRRNSDHSISMQRRKARARAARLLKGAAGTPLNLPVWTVGALNFADSEYIVHESLAPEEVEVFTALAPEYEGSIGELIELSRNLLHSKK